MDWYVLHTRTGQEENVKTCVEKTAMLKDLKDQIGKIVIPTEMVSEVRGGKKKVSERKFFPGYILIEMKLTDETWYLIRNIQGVSGFISSGAKPVPLKKEEVDMILAQSEKSQEKPIPKVLFEKGEPISVIDGPFMNFNGVIDEVNPLKGKLRVSISIFGRATPVELEYWQVEKT